MIAAVLLPLLFSATPETWTSTSGSIRAKIVYSGPVTRARKIDPATNSEVCGARRSILTEDLVVAGNDGLVNTAGFLVDPPDLGPSTANAVLEQENCVFLPHVQTVTAGGQIAIGNQDPVIHNVHARTGGTTIFNVGMPLRGVRVKKDVGGPGVVTLQCDSGHTWMRAYLVVVPHGHHATSNATGELVLNDVPKGSYTLRTWHERLGVIDTPVKVEAGKETAVTVTYRPSKQRLSVDATALPRLDLGSRAAAEAAHAKSALAELAERAKREAELSRSETDKLRKDAELAQRQARRDTDVAAGGALYGRWCATCHGPLGNGRGESAGSLKFRPRDFTRGEFEFRTTKSGELAREDDLFRTITAGIPGTDMPAWGKILDAGDRRKLARYVMSFSDRYVNADPPAPIVIPPEKPNEPVSVLQGRAWYHKLQCRQCHGDDGRAGGVSQRMIDDWGQPIDAPDLTRGIYQSGTTPQDLYRTLATGLSGTPMPSFADQIGPSDMWDLVHFVMSLAEPSPLRDIFGLP